MRVGRRRQSNTSLPAGVRLIGGRYYWQPTSKAERDKRKVDGLKASEALGPVLDQAAREKWAELSGFRDPVKAGTEGTVDELLTLFERDGIKTKLNGKPRAARTIAEYKGYIKRVLRPRFGAMRYGKTATEAMAGRAIGTTHLQTLIFEADHKVAANHAVACLSSVFAYAKAVAGKTSYNPCEGVTKAAETPRDREALPWEAEVLLAVATPLMALMIRFECICGWREGDMLRLSKAQFRHDGIKLKHGKRGKRQHWYWSPELESIIKEALAMPRRRRRKMGEPINSEVEVLPSIVFAKRDGDQLTESGFQSLYQRTVERANKLLAECEVPLKIENLHFHDLRSMAGDDADEQGQDRAEFLGDSPAVADRVYARREKKVRPIR